MRLNIRNWFFAGNTQRMMEFILLQSAVDSGIQRTAMMELQKLSLPGEEYLYTKRTDAQGVYWA